MKHILTTLALAATFVGCNKHNNNVKPVPKDLIKYFACFTDNSTWHYADTSTRTYNTITISKTAVGETTDTREQTFRAVGTGLTGEEGFVYEIGTNYAHILTQATVPETILELIYDSGSFSVNEQNKSVEIIPEMHVYRHIYTNVLHYTNPSGTIREMWFGEGFGLIQYKNKTNTYMLTSL